MDTIRDFLKDLFTLRTVWIDRGQGRWAVKKRLHPLLRGLIGTLALIAVAVVYSEIHTPASVEAETKPAIVTAFTEPLPKAPPAAKPAFVEPVEPVPAVAPQPEPVPEIMPLVFPEPAEAEEPQPIVVPVRTQTRSRVTLPSDTDPETDRIIPPVKPKPKRTDSRPRTALRTDTLLRPERMPNPSSGKYSLHISKRTHILTLMRDGEPVKEYGIAVGRNPGDKQRVGDCRTPTGSFKITMIQDASTWTHDFHDGKGKIKGAYGPYFMRLDAKGWQGIGIHGTHAPESIGTNATEGCIRLNNADLLELRRYAYRRMPVIISEL